MTAWLARRSASNDRCYELRPLMKQKRSRPLALRHADLSAGIIKVPPRWQATLMPTGVHGWVCAVDRSLRATTSLGDYGPIGLWWLVSVSTTDGNARHAPSHAQIELARRMFCAPDARTEEHASPSGLWYIWQRVTRGAWKRHPDSAQIESKRMQLGLPDLSFPPDTDSDPSCPECGSTTWLRQQRIDSLGAARPLLVCRDGEHVYDPAELYNELAQTN